VYQQIYHDEFLVVLNNAPLQLMQLFDWNLIASKVTQHGEWDTKRSHERLDLGVAGMHNSRPSNLAYGLSVPRKLGEGSMSCQDWVTDLFESATVFLRHITKYGTFFNGDTLFPMKTSRHVVGAGQISKQNCVEFLRVHISQELHDHYDSCNSDDPSFAAVVTVIQWCRRTPMGAPKRMGVTFTGRKSMDLVLSGYSGVLPLLQSLQSFFHRSISFYSTEISAQSLCVLRETRNVKLSDWVMIDGDVQALLNLIYGLCGPRSSLIVLS
jgi:hypothetical protein